MTIPTHREPDVRRPIGKTGRLGSILLILVLTLVACSPGEDEFDPTPGSATSTTAATIATTGGTALPIAPPATPRVVGDLVDIMGLAWATVTSYRSTTVQGSGDLSAVALPGTPVPGVIPVDPAGEASQAAIDEIVLPDQRHYLESNGGSVSEFLATGGSVFARGRYTQIAVRPDLDATTWVNLDPAFISPDSPVGQVLAQFAPATSPVFRPPLSDLQPDTRALELTAGGPVVVDGRDCTAWSWTDTGDTGEAMTRTLSLDGAGLPCTLEFTAGDYASRTTWGAFNTLAPMSPPSDWVTVGETLDMGMGQPAATPAP